TTKNMFKGAAKFNQPPVLDKNDDSKNWTLPPTVEDTSYMFEGATSFNQNLSAWNLAEEAKRKDMFNGSPILKEKAKLPRVGNQEIDPLEKPSTLEAGKVQTTAMELTWSSVKGAADYRLYYSTKKGFGLMDTGVTARHFSTAGPFQLALEGLASGTLYYFKLVATGEKYWSSPVSELAQRTKLAVPQGFRASVPAQNAHEQIQLTWTAVAGAASYTVYYSKDAGDLNDLSAFDAGSDPKTKGKKAGITATTANIAGLEGWAHYSFRLVAVAKEGAHLNSLLGSPIAYKVAKIRPATKAKLVEAIKVLYKGYGTLATDTTVKDDDTKEGATASLATIDTGLIPDMSYLFKGKEHFNGDISGWDTRKVTTMKQMFGGSTTSGDGADQKVNFHGAKAFNQDIGGWDVREVTDMSGMFMDAVKFNNGGSPAINNWKTLKVTDMSGMFLQASGFDQPIGGWDVGKVTTMGAMFFQAAAFNRPIGSWTVAQVTNMSTMFYAAKVFNQPIGTWDVSGITVADNMSGMFYSAAAFSKSLSAWEEHLQQALKTLPARIFDSSGLACSGSDDEKNKIKAKWPSSWQSSCS
ncbi:MAG: BspA family leucine-rich repeat surface protein, partial [Spirochaetota bacterium]